MIVARGADDGGYINRFDGANWSGWVGLGGVILSPPSATSANGLVYVAGRGADNGVYLNAGPGGQSWRGWVGLGGSTTLAPTVASRGGLVADVFAMDAGTGAPYHRAAS